MPIPLIIGGIASAASAIGSAKIQSNAAKKAATAQQAGTDKALAVQQQANAPYMALGQQGAQRLQQTPFQPYTQQFRPGQPNNGFQAPQGGATLGSIGSMGQSQGAPMGGAMTQPQMVQLQAPDGSTKPFPAQDVPRIIAQAKAAGHDLRVVN
jgi:hypothetical protein